MKKTLLALAVLSAFTGVASAQSSVTLSGTVDAGVRRQGTATGNDWTFSGSQSGYNGITFSGNEDLGGGMKAFFSLNHRFVLGTGGGNSPTNGPASCRGSDSRQPVGSRHSRRPSCTSILHGNRVPMLRATRPRKASSRRCEFHR